MHGLQLLIFILASVGATIIVTNSSIFEPARDYVESKSEFLGELLGCPLCFGFWAGLMLALFNNCYSGQYYLGGIFPIYGALISSLASWTAASLVDCVQSISLYYEYAANHRISLAQMINNFDEEDIDNG